MNLAKTKTVSYRSEIYCKCDVCKSWDRESEGSWECREIECGCEEKVNFVVKRVSTNLNELMLTYECAADNCGFKIAAHDENCRAYVSVVKIVASYLFWHTREKCACRKNTMIVVERVTAGEPVEDPTKQRSIQLNNELQPFYMCALQKCEYRKSIPQIVVESERRRIECVCSKPTIYHAEKKVYACAQVDGGCGVCFHELDSLTYVCTEISRSETVDSVWCCLSKSAKIVCGMKGVLKYRLCENFMIGELLYECRQNNSCRQVKRDVFIPSIFHNDVEI
jgi:hypothetical protein